MCTQYNSLKLLNCTIRFERLSDAIRITWFDFKFCCRNIDTSRTPTLYNLNKNYRIVLIVNGVCRKLRNARSWLRYSVSVSSSLFFLISLARTRKCCNCHSSCLGSWCFCARNTNRENRVGNWMDSSDVNSLDNRSSSFFRAKSLSLKFDSKVEIS